MAYWLPLFMVIACMSLCYLPVAPKGYLLLRIIFASIIGSHYVFSYCAASQTAGGPGVGMIYVVGLCFTIFFYSWAVWLNSFSSASNDKK
jgi:hypothetical protein